MIKVGLLPLYIKLYDDGGCERKELEEFYDKIASLIEKEGFEVVKTDICRIKPEFDNAVKTFENSGADAIITLHLAYSPSLESIDALAKTKLPIVVLDTTEGYSFSNKYSKSPLMYNHGIHGVMDMCNLLKRNGKKYAITVGHINDGKVIKNACDLVRASVSAKLLSGSKTGLFGTSFKGMGDFIVSPKDVKKRFGIDVFSIPESEIIQTSKAITDKEIQDELAYYKQNFEFDEDINEEYCLASVRANLTVRKLVKKYNLDAFSMNFLDITKENLNSIPFIECCLQMQNGVGYAGEGDALTASFVGAIAKTFKDYSFIEIFCPDWKENRIFISHMGEMNYQVSSVKPKLKTSPFIYSSAESFMAGYAEFKEGQAVFCNVFRGENEKFKFLVSNIEMVHVDTHDFDGGMRGWFKPNGRIEDFLAKISENGAIHHSFIVYNTDVKTMKTFGELLDMDVIEI